MIKAHFVVDQILINLRRPFYEGMSSLINQFYPTHNDPYESQNVLF